MDGQRFTQTVARMMGGDKALPEWAHLPHSAREAGSLVETMNQEPAPAREEDGGEYARYLSSPDWRWTRLVVLVLARGLCAKCGGRAVQVHHLTYERRGNELLRDLIPLCDPCHRAEHGIVGDIRIKDVATYCRTLPRRSSLEQRAAEIA